MSSRGKRSDRDEDHDSRGALVAETRRRTEEAGEAQIWGRCMSGSEAAVHSMGSGGSVRGRMMARGRWRSDLGKEERGGATARGVVAPGGRGRVEWAMVARGWARAHGHRRWGGGGRRDAESGTMEERGVLTVVCLTGAR